MADLPSWVDEWCSRFLGARPDGLLFAASHVSEVFGVRLADGREVVVKHRADESGRTRACVSAQRLLAEQGFPCPMPLTEVIVDDGVATHAELFVPGGHVETLETTAAAARSAALLADLVRRLASLRVDPPLPNPEWVRWDESPELPEATAVPAWIDEYIRRVQTKLAGCDLAPRLGHADWLAQNIRWRNGAAHVVHDWDSLAWLPEAALAGCAAGIFPARDHVSLASLASSKSFLDAYERERGAIFSPSEREIAWAASSWEALHTAREELIHDRPRRSYESLQAQRLERLALANLT